MKTPLATLAAIAFGAVVPLSAAPFLKATDNGIAIENGGLKATLAFPATVNAAKAKGKLQEKTLTETGGTLKYQDGSRIDLGILNGEVTFKLSGTPTDTQTLAVTLTLDTAAAAGGKWRFDAKAGDFPAAQTGGQIYQGNAASFSIIPSTGPGIAITLPDSPYQQLMDLRQFQKKEFFWQCWIPLKAGTETLTLKIGDATGGSPPPVSPAGDTPAPKEVEKKADPDRQTYGQLGGMPPEKKSGTRILKWKDGKKAAYLLGFDDNGTSHLTTVIPALEKHKMVGNFYINPGTGLFTKNQAKWEQVAKSPYVHLCNHTLLHSGTQSVAEFEADLLKTSDAIYALTPHLRKPRIIAFRTPGGVPWKVSKDEVKAVLAKNHMVDRPWLDGPPLTMKTLPPVLASVDTALAGGGTGFMDFHGVGGDPNSCPAEFLTALLEKLEEHRDQFWITDTVSWFQYQEQRKKSELKVLQSDDRQVRASLTTAADPAYYDLPLTVAVEVPAAWKACTITQGGKTQKATAEGGEVRFDAVPGADEIVIKPQ